MDKQGYSHGTTYPADGLSGSYYNNGELVAAMQLIQTQREVIRLQDQKIREMADQIERYKAKLLSGDSK